MSTKKHTFFIFNIILFNIQFFTLVFKQTNALYELIFEENNENH